MLLTCGWFSLYRACWLTFITGTGRMTPQARNMGQIRQVPGQLTLIGHKLFSSCNIFMYFIVAQIYLIKAIEDNCLQFTMKGLWLDADLPYLTHTVTLTYRMTSYISSLSDK